MTPYCDQCGGPIDQMRPGRVARFCSDRCRVAFHRAVIPEAMRQENRWATYAWPEEQPLRTDGRGPALVADPHTWSSYAQVRAFRSKGYMVGGGIGCVDIEGCVIRGTTQLHPVIEERIAPLVPKTYIEVSPSLNGLRIFGLMNEDHGWLCDLNDGITIELQSKEKFVIVTGQRWSKSSRLGHIRQHFHDLAPVLGG